MNHEGNPYLGKFVWHLSHPSEGQDGAVAPRVHRPLEVQVHAALPEGTALTSSPSPPKKTTRARLTLTIRRPTCREAEISIDWRATTTCRAHTSRKRTRPYRFSRFQAFSGPA